MILKHEKPAHATLVFFQHILNPNKYCTRAVRTRTDIKGIGIRVNMKYTLRIPQFGTVLTKVCYILFI